MKLIYAIMGCHNVNLVNKVIHQNWLADSKKVNAIEQELRKQGKKMSIRQNILIISEKDSKNIKQTFEQLSLNRLRLGESDVMKPEKVSSHPFKPTVSKSSAEYAEKYRQRMLAESEQLLAEEKMSFKVPKGGELEHFDMLMLDSKRKDTLIAQKRNAVKQERQLQEEESMGPMQSQRTSGRSSREKDRNHELYELGTTLNQQKKDRPFSQIEEEKWKMELTFKPTINNPSKLNPTLTQPFHLPADYDKAVYRMQQGRQSREKSSSIQSDPNASPVFYLNVAVTGTQPTKVPVFNNDTIHSITAKVKKMLKL